jgi:5-methylcytosine-specific restriction endonuclease McrA
MARWMVCSTPDCAELHQGNGKCPDCRHESEKRRGTASQRGYGSTHRKAGDEAIAGATHCTHCGQPFTDGNPVQRGHKVPIRDGGTTADGYEPHCRRCNLGWTRTGL